MAVYHSLVFTNDQYKRLLDHLCADDGCESAAIILCHSGTGASGHRLIASEFIFIAPESCSKRSATQITWPFAENLPAEKIAQIDNRGLSILTIHSHPTGTEEFSETDNKNDRALFHSVCEWFDDERPHGSAILVPSGEIFARLVNSSGNFSPVNSVSVVGPNIQIWKHAPQSDRPIEAGVRVSQTFGAGTFNLLRNMRVGVIGCSGTGSIIAELLARNCIGHLTLVDPDCVEEKNLNRIMNAMQDDAFRKRAKVKVLQKAIQNMGTGVAVEAYQSHTSSETVTKALVECDVLFGCVDSAEGRYHLECIASAYRIPYFDVGVNLEANNHGGITQADAVTHYMHPGNTDLMARGGYTSEQLTAENWRRTDRQYYESQRIAGYLAAVGEDHPAVMSLNMQAACMAFNDFLARLHRFRLDDNDDFSEQRYRLVHGCYENKSIKTLSSPLFSKYSGMGDKSFLIQQLKKNASQN